MSINGRGRQSNVNLTAKGIAGAAAYGEMDCASGAKKRHAANSTATTQAVRPVRPPALVPAALST